MPDRPGGDAPAGAIALIVIPARFGSTRLPGKPLREIAGHTLLARTVALARVAMRELDDVALVVATDHNEIAAHARALGIDVAMTASDLPSGSDRALAAAGQQGVAPGVVLNLQGDSPFLSAEAVRATLAAARSGGADVATPVVRLSWAALDAMRAHKAQSPASGTTCIRLADGSARWFSKAILPAIRNEAALRTREPLSPVWRHIGLYAYRLAALRRFAALPPSPHERLEGLEQLRFLENGMTIAAVEVAPPRFDISGIDTEADIARAEALIAVHGDPYEA